MKSELSLVTPSVPFFADLVHPTTSVGCLRARKGRRRHDLVPPNTLGTELGTNTQSVCLPWCFTVLQGVLFPCPAVRNFPCNSVGPFFHSSDFPYDFTRVPLDPDGSSGTFPGTPQHLRDQTWVPSTERVSLVVFRYSSGDPLPLSCSQNFPL